MIPASQDAAQRGSISARRIQGDHPAADWRRSYRECITDPHELLALLGLTHIASCLPADCSDFPLRVPRGLVTRMRQGDPDDPLLRQVLPLDQEYRPVAGFKLDAVGDLDSRHARGVLHKYQGRALLVATGSCVVHCRYCFRRHFPYAEEIAATASWRAAVDYVRDDPSIQEVILSGGDPLSLSTAKLAELGDALLTIPHVRRLRIHSRLPTVLPERIDGELLDWLEALPLQKVIVVHANHPNEVDGEVGRALQALRAAGTTVLNQAVLLRGVNDCAITLETLSEQLFRYGVLPYYLHQLDRVAGAAQFEVPDQLALELIDQLRRQLPGYLVPRLVREIAGEPGKTPLALGEDSASV